MAASALKLLVGGKRHIVPLDRVIVQDHLSHLFVSIVIQASKKVASPVAEGHGRVLSWRWNPVLMGCYAKFCIEGFSLLHSLYIGLQTSSKLFSQLIPWNFITRISCEQLWTIAIIF